MNKNLNKKRKSDNTPAHIEQRLPGLPKSIENGYYAQRMREAEERRKPQKIKQPKFWQLTEAELKDAEEYRKLHPLPEKK